MAKITIMGQAIVITSSLKLDDIRTVQKYRPDALILKGGEDGKEQIFKVGTGAGSVNRYGISFSDETRDDAKLACMTIVTDYTGGDIKDYVAEGYGPVLTKLNSVESAVSAVLEEIAAEKAAIAENITVVG